MSPLIICQARMESTRLPGKVMMPLAGEPLLLRFIERIRRSKYGHSLVVAPTNRPSDHAIVELCLLHGIDVMRGHPTDLLDRHYQAALQHGADVVVKIPSDCPLIDPTVIDLVIDAHLAKRDAVDYTSNLHPATFPDGNDVEVMSMRTLRRAWSEAAKPYEREHTTPWMWDANPTVRCQNVVWPTGHDMSMTQRWTIDYPEDYIFIRSIYDALYERMPRFGIPEILAYLDQHPEVSAMNASLAGVNWYRHHLDELRSIHPSQTNHGQAHESASIAV